MSNLMFLASAVMPPVEAAVEKVGFFQDGLFWAFLGAALAVLLAGIGSARGVGIVAESATGLLAENPSLFGKVILLVALPGTQGIYGLLIGFVACLNLGLFGDALVEITLQQGLYMFAACMPMAIVGLFSALYQGRAAASAVNILTKNPNDVVKGVVVAAMVETYALFALLISFLMVNFIIK